MATLQKTTRLEEVLVKQKVETPDGGAILTLTPHFADGKI